MSDKSKKLRAYYRSLYERATKGLTKRPDGKGYIEEQVIDNLVGLLSIDVDAEKHAKARAIIDNLAKPDEEGDDDDPQLELWGDTYSFGSRRLIRDAEGNVDDNQSALLAAKIADTERARVHAHRVNLWVTRKSREQEHFARWALDESLKGRPMLELTWGNCARETGILRRK